MKKQSGFTLTEIMIVVAVFAIMAAVAIPAFMSLLPGMRLNGAARQVVGDFMAARMKAVKLNQRTKVFFRIPGTPYLSSFLVPGFSGLSFRPKRCSMAPTKESSPKGRSVIK